MPNVVEDQLAIAGKSVVAELPGNITMAPLDVAMNSSLVMFMSGTADMFPSWGFAPRARDAQLRLFWPTEPLFASALWDIVSKYASFKWNLVGPARTTKIYQNILAGSEDGQGWQPLMTKTLIDLLTQDNGAFIEVIRMADDPNSPCVGLKHLDAGQCFRTGKREEPVIYWDVRGRSHLMKWYQVISLAEMPAPQDRAFGAQYSALTRVLRAAQIMRAYSIYKNEKISGRFQKQIHLVSGIQRKVIDDALVQSRIQNDASGNQMYITPAIIASLDPQAKVAVATLELAGMPDGFDAEKELKEYITNLAMAFGGDYGDFAPLPGGNLGSSSQSKMMHQKSKGKGSQSFMDMMSQVLNFRGILPDTVTFMYDEQDMQAEMDKAQLHTARATERQIRIASGEITKDVARQMARSDGDLTDDQLKMMGQDPNDPNVVADSNVPVDISPTTDVKPMTPADTTPGVGGGAFGSGGGGAGAGEAGAATTGMPNSNLKTKLPPGQSQKQ